MTKKAISAGVIVTDGVQLLLGHVTNHKNWDIPKGHVDDQEGTLAAAQRELHEETGLTVSVSELFLLGLYDYKPKKDLQLYVWPRKIMPDPATCVCRSKFKGAKGWQSELDAFKLVNWRELDTYCNPDLVRVLRICETQSKLIVKTHAR